MMKNKVLKKGKRKRKRKTPSKRQLRRWGYAAHVTHASVKPNAKSDRTMQAVEKAMQGVSEAMPLQNAHQRAQIHAEIRAAVHAEVATEAAHLQDMHLPPAAEKARMKTAIKEAVIHAVSRVVARQQKRLAKLHMN